MWLTLPEGKSSAKVRTAVFQSALIGLGRYLNKHHVFHLFWLNNRGCCPPAVCLTPHCCLESHIAFIPTHYGLQAVYPHMKQTSCTQSIHCFLLTSSFNRDHLSRQVLKLLGNFLPNELYMTERIDFPCWCLVWSSRRSSDVLSSACLLNTSGSVVHVV